MEKNYSSNKCASNLEKIRNLKKKADELSQDYHENIEKLKFYDKDVEFMTKKINSMENKLDKLIQTSRPLFEKISKEKANPRGSTSYPKGSKYIKKNLLTSN